MIYFGNITTAVSLRCAQNFPVDMIIEIIKLSVVKSFKITFRCVSTTWKFLGTCWMLMLDNWYPFQTMQYSCMGIV